MAEHSLGEIKKYKTNQNYEVFTNQRPSGGGGRGGQNVIQLYVDILHII